MSGGAFAHLKALRASKFEDLEIKRLGKPKRSLFQGQRHILTFKGVISNGDS